jgi:hypothetical protein
MNIITNMGRYDRIFRFVVGLVAVAAMFGGSLSTYLTVRIVLGIVGVVMVFTGIFGFCPLYRLLGVRT